MNSEPSPSDLLDIARGLLGGTRPDRNRIACWITRAAMENAVNRLLESRGLDVGRASMRSKLTCVQVACSDTDLPARCEYLWTRLSEACHQHAYELSPTVAESSHLISLVATLDQK